MVLASSIVALPLVSPGEAKPTEADWRSDLSVPYNRAKVLGERTAWQLAEEHKVDLVTILPGAVLDPVPQADHVARHHPGRDARRPRGFVFMAIPLRSATV